jgi:hypothetical protein
MRDRLKQGEQGQIVALLAVALLSLLAISALIMNVGYSWYAKRQAQAQVDAAVLAAAQELPDTAKATQLANDYLAKNPLPGGVTGGTPTITFTHLQNSRNGAPVNKVTISENGTIPSLFGNFVGLTSFNYSVNANACEPCGNKKFDIMLVVDRTGSMCDVSSNCVDLNNAKTGMRELFATMDAKLDSIGIVAFPPVPVTSKGACEPVPAVGSDHYTAGQYDNPTWAFLADPLKMDYQKPDGTANTASTLYTHTVTGDINACIPAGGGTSYTQALQAGIDELNKDGRSGAQKIIIFMTDGSANTGPVHSCTTGHYAGMTPCTNIPATDPQNVTPCHAAISIAQTAKNAGILFYTIGYGLATSGNDTVCWRGVWKKSGGGIQLTPPIATDPGYDHEAGNGLSGAQESPTISPRTTLQTIATTPSMFYDAAAGDVRPVFQAIASDIENGTSHLVDDGA